MNFNEQNISSASIEDEIEYYDEATGIETEDTESEQTVAATAQPHTINRKTRILVMVAVCMGAAFQLAALVVMLICPITVFGDGLNILSIIDSVLKLTSYISGGMFSGGNFNMIYSLAVIPITFAIVYIIYLVMTIKNTVKVATSCAKYFKSGAEAEKLSECKNISAFTAKTLLLPLQLAFVGFILTGDKPTAGIIAIAVFTGIFYTYVCLFPKIADLSRTFLKTKNGITTLVFAVLKPILNITLLSLMVVFMAQPAFLNCVYGIEFLVKHASEFNIVVLASDCIKNLLLGEAIRRLFVLIHATVYREVIVKYTSSKEKRKLIGEKHMIIVILVLVCICAVLTCIPISGSMGATDSSVLLLGRWFGVLKTSYLPTIALLVARLLIPKEVFESPEAPEKPKSEPI